LKIKKVLLIAEKPSLMRDIKTAYESLPVKEKEYDITYISLVGHILSLKDPEEYDPKWGKPWRNLPMFPKEFTYKIKEPQVFLAAKQELSDKSYDFVINACDAGREGELIFYSVYKHSGSKLPIKRLWINDTTIPTIVKGMKNLIDGKEMVNLRKSAELRSYSDWLSGMNFSRAVTISTGDLIAVGRVMTPTLAIIVRRWEEIQNFVPKDFYEIEGIFSDKTDFNGIWIDLKSKETRIDKKKDAENIITRLKNEKTGIVHNIQKKQEKHLAPALHSLLDLQREASSSLGFTADETLKLAQSLYEGKFITYPRTESQCLPENFQNEIQKSLKAIEGLTEFTGYIKGITTERIKEICLNKKYVNNKKLTDHHAIVPTAMPANFNKMNQKEQSLYNLIARRFLAIFLDPHIVDKTLILVKIKDDYFKCLGNIVKQEGFKELYKFNKKDTILPDLKKGDKVNLKKLTLLSKKTSPPDLYDDSTLLQAMKDAGKMIEDENLKEAMKGSGLGTAATRAAIIEKLILKKMMKRKGKKIIPTDFGVKIIKTLSDFQSNIISPELTAIWEEKLEEIEEGKLEADVFYQELIEYIRDNTEKFLGGKMEEFEEKCPSCKSEIHNRPKGYQCSNSKCGFTVWKEMMKAEITKEDAVSLVKGKEIVKTLTKKDGTSFTGKLYYDKENNKVGLKSMGDYEEIGDCPKCKKKVLEKSNFYTCEDYPDKCDFLIGKKICGADVSKKDVALLLGGKSTKVKKMKFKSGKDGSASLKLNGTKIEFEFETKK
jgi:DNA topoisomerase III